MKTILILCAVTITTLLGDYGIKVASGKPDGLFSKTFILGAVLYSMPAIGWYFLMKSNSLAMIGVLFSASTVIFLAMLGVLVFKEAFGWREGIGISLAVLAVAVMSHK